MTADPVAAPERLAARRRDLEVVRENMIRAQVDTLARNRKELAELRRAESPAALLAAAPRGACRAGGFDRAMISTVRGSVWTPVALHLESGATNPVNMVLAEYVQNREIPLTSTMPEAELIRRRSPVIVSRPQTDPQVFQPLVDFSATREYVAAPVQAAGTVIGFLHADCHDSGRPLTVTDRDRLHDFAEGVGLALERVVHIERLKLQRRRLDQAINDVHAAVDGLATAADRLVFEHPIVEVRHLTVTDGGSPAAPNGFTPREGQVMTLLLSGATNAEIANRLTVSETTVKSHVKHILRKLQASNRAEAIARYLDLARNRGGG